MHETFSKQIMKTRKEFYAQSLTFIRLYYTIIRLQKSKNVPVAQLDRVFDYESKGRGFESLLAHHKVILRMKCVEWLFIMSGDSNPQRFMQARAKREGRAIPSGTLVE